MGWRKKKLRTLFLRVSFDQDTIHINPTWTWTLEKRNLAGMHPEKRNLEQGGAPKNVTWSREAPPQKT